MSSIPAGEILDAVACPEYLHCEGATTDGCSQYVGDTENSTMLVELYDRAEHRREQARAAPTSPPLASRISVLTARTRLSAIIP
jgi:hypothetical protein